jgi:hypothetical protein
MKKGLLFVLCMLLCLAIQAQSKPDNSRAEEKKQEVREAGKEEKKETEVKKEIQEVKPESKAQPAGKEVVKSVPAAKSQHAKPARIDNRRGNTARPATARPARNPRPAARVVNPGRGR